ncbi:MAG TPA: DUF1295 domain-containing protein [Cyclobacteriaceae bacterium]|jgi:hypothetical protein
MTSFFLEKQTYYYLLTGWILIALLSYPFLRRKTQPYGRHTTSKWGPLIDNKIGWILMELPALIVAPALYIIGNGEKNLPMDFFMFLWVFHYVNRALVFPLRTKTSGKKIPVAIVASAIIFNCINGFFNGYYFGFLSPFYESHWYYDGRFLIGLFFFIAGLAINWTADNQLIRIRRNSSDGYKIPYGGLFEYVSCPNHFGEILEWFGFAILTWSLPAFSFSIWTFVNLIPRSKNHHRWYKEQFPDYPVERRAVIPFVT